MNWQEVFVRERNRFLAGRGEIAVFGTLGTYFALGTIWIQTFLPNDTTAQTIFTVVLGTGFIFGSWLIGYAFDKTKVFHAMNQFNNSRNEQWETMLKEINEIKKKLEEK